MRKLFALKDSSLLGQTKVEHQNKSIGLLGQKLTINPQNSESSGTKIEATIPTPANFQGIPPIAARGRGRPKKLIMTNLPNNENETASTHAGADLSSTLSNSNSESGQQMNSRNSNNRRHSAHIESPLLSPILRERYGEAFRFDYIPRAHSDKPRMTEMEANLHILKVMKEETDPLKPYLSKHCERYFYHTMYQLIDYSRRTSPLKFCYHCYSFRHRDSRKDQKFAARFVSDMFPYEDESEELIQAHWHSFLMHTIDYFVKHDIVRYRDDGSLQFRLPSIGKCTSAHKENVQASVCKFTIFYKDKIDTVDAESPNHSTFLPWGKTKTYDENLKPRRGISRQSNSSGSDCTFLKIGASEFLASSPLYSSSVSSGINFIQSSLKPAQPQRKDPLPRQEAYSWSPPSHGGAAGSGFQTPANLHDPFDDLSIEVDPGAEPNGENQLSLQPSHGRHDHLGRDRLNVQKNIRDLGNNGRQPQKPTLLPQNYEQYQKRYENQYHEPGDSESTAASRLQDDPYGSKLFSQDESDQFESGMNTPNFFGNGNLRQQAPNQQFGLGSLSISQSFPRDFMQKAVQEEPAIPQAFLNSQPLVLPKRRYGCRGFLSKIPVRVPTGDDLEEIDDEPNELRRNSSGFPVLGKRRLISTSRSNQYEVDIDVDDDEVSAEIHREPIIAANRTQNHPQASLQVTSPSMQSHSLTKLSQQMPAVDKADSVESIERNKGPTNDHVAQPSRIDPDQELESARFRQSVSTPTDIGFDPSKVRRPAIVTGSYPSGLGLGSHMKPLRTIRRNPWLHQQGQSSSSSGQGQHYRSRIPGMEGIPSLHMPRFRIDGGDSDN